MTLSNRLALALYASVLRAMETMQPENPPPSAAPAAGGEGSGADWDPVR